MPPRIYRPVLLIAVLAVLAATAGVLLADRSIFSHSSQKARPDLQRVLDGLVTGKDRIAPGATAYVSGPHGTWVGSAGVANVKTGEPMTPDARLRLMSLSKAWTATVILKLVAEGRMQLDDTVAHWLP